MSFPIPPKRLTLDTPRTWRERARSRYGAVCAVAAGLLVLLQPLVRAQALESYIDRKNSEKQMPNRYLQGETMDKSDQLSKYYRRAFSSQQSRRDFQFGPQTGTEEAGALSQIKMPVGVALDGAIDPAAYPVGPLDVLSINIWGEPAPGRVPAPGPRSPARRSPWLRAASSR